MPDDNRASRFVTEGFTGIRLGNSECIFCVHADPHLSTCKAFPKGVPGDILAGHILHRTPREGDNGIVFERKVRAND